MFDWDTDKVEAQDGGGGGSGSGFGGFGSGFGSWGSGGSSIGSYHYDWNTGNYYDSWENKVSYNEVHNNYIVPNSSADKLYYHETQMGGYSSGKMIDGFKLNGTLYEFSNPVPYNQLVIDPQGQGTNSTGGVDGTFVAGALVAGAEHATYSKEFGTWMGKDLKIRSQTWGGNGITGGKNSFAKSTSGAIGIAGKVVGAYSMYNSYSKWQNGDINNALFVGDMVSGLVGMFGGVYGASWSIGYDLGKSYGPSKWFSQKPQESVVLEYLKTNKTGE
jgi:hypothetical protein